MDKLLEIMSHVEECPDCPMVGMIESLYTMMRSIHPSPNRSSTTSSSPPSSNNNTTSSRKRNISEVAPSSSTTDNPTPTIIQRVDNAPFSSRATQVVDLSEDASTEEELPDLNEGREDLVPTPSAPGMSNPPPWINPSSIRAAQPPSSQLCSICMEELPNVKFSAECRHSFCPICIAQWAQVNNSCPNCRKPFSNSELIKIIDLVELSQPAPTEAPSQQTSSSNSNPPVPSNTSSTNHVPGKCTCCRTMNAGGRIRNDEMVSLGCACVYSVHHGLFHYHKKETDHRICYVCKHKRGVHYELKGFVTSNDLEIVPQGNGRFTYKTQDGMPLPAVYEYDTRQKRWKFKKVRE